MRSLAILALFLLLVQPVAAQRNCVKGKPCGNSCIARDKVCHVGEAVPAKPTLTTAAPAAIPDSIKWIGWRGRKVYFKTGCVWLAAVPAPERVYFVKESMAKDSGYKRSKPDEGC